MGVNRKPSRKKNTKKKSRSRAVQAKPIDIQSGEVTFINVVSHDERLALVDNMHIGEVDRQCTNALRALADMDRAVNSGSSKDDDLWYAAQALTVAVGNLSKSLLGTAARSSMRPTALQRASRLRERLEVSTEASWLLRNVRDSFEHFDERLDQWGEQTLSFPVTDRNVVRKDVRIRYVVKDSGHEVPAERWREYNVARDTLSYQGQELQLGAIRTELPKLQARAKEERAKRPVIAGDVEFEAKIEGLPENTVAKVALHHPHNGQPVASFSTQKS